MEILGYTANREDTAVIEQLEALRSKSVETHTVSYERVDTTQFAWFEELALERKGDAPDEMIRIKHTPTGLLDKKLLETALTRIRQRMPVS
jgi:hypothetical protein